MSEPRLARRVLLCGAVLGQPMGGVRRHNQELLPRMARALEQRGGELAILEGTQPPAFPLPPSVRRIPSRVPPRPVLVRATLEGRYLRKALAEAQDEGRPFDLVHTAHLPVPRELPVPYCITLHDLKVLDLEHTPMSRRLVGRQVVARAVDRAASVVAVSESLRTELAERFGTDTSKVHVVPNGADHLEVLPREQPDEPFWLYVGHLEPRKNVELLVRALACDENLPRLKLAGANRGNERERLTALARELGVTNRLEFLGEADDTHLSKLYSQASCVALPSLREGFGIPIVEAQRAGAPVCVADIPALREVSASAPSFDPHDPSACARAAVEAAARPVGRCSQGSYPGDPAPWKASVGPWLGAWDSAVGGRQASHQGN